MKKLISILILFVGLFMSAAVAASNGSSQGQPFIEQQEAFETAIAAEEAARIAADQAEAATRAAADATLSAELAAEKAARIANDLAIEAQIAANAALIMDVENRVSVLEGLSLDRSITWTETSSPDLINMGSDIASLNYQPGDWVAIVSRHGQHGWEIGNCISHPGIELWLDTIVNGLYVNTSIPGTGSFLLTNGSWINSPTIHLYVNMQSSIPTVSLRGTNWNHQLHDRVLYPYYRGREVYLYSAGVIGGFAIGNTFTINVASTRLEACGF